MRRDLTCLCLPLLFALTACDGDSRRSTTTPSGPANAPDVFQAGRYELLISSGALSNTCDGPVATANGPDAATGAAHFGTVTMRSEGGDWIATATAPGDTLRLRFTFDDWPHSRAFTGSVEGRAARPFPEGPNAPIVEIHGRGASGAARLSGDALDKEQGLGPIEAFGTVSGQLVFTSPGGAVTCSSGNVILQRANF